MTTLNQLKDLLLNHFVLQEEYVESIRKYNIKSGVQGDMWNYVQWRPVRGRRLKYENFCKSITNPDNNDRFYDISYLRRLEEISNEDSSPHEKKKYPYFDVDSLARVQTPDSKEWIVSLKGYYGMDRNGEEIRVSFNEGDFWYRPSVQYTREPMDPKDPKSKLIKVGIIRDNEGRDAGDIQYLTPFSLDKVKELSKHFKNKPGEAQTTFSIRRDGHTNSHTCTYEDFISGDFTSLFDRLTKPAVSWDQFYKGMTQMTELETKIVKEKPYR